RRPRRRAGLLLGERARLPGLHRRRLVSELRSGCGGAATGEQDGTAGDRGTGARCGFWPHAGRLARMAAGLTQSRLRRRWAARRHCAARARQVAFVVLLTANAASYVVAGAFVRRLPAIRPAAREPGHRDGYRAVLRDRPCVGLALLNVVVALHDSLLLVAMPLWILTRTSAPLALTGLLFTLNTVLVVLLQVRAARRIAARRGISASYRTAALSFVAACVAFTLTAGASTPVAVVLLVIALAALTRGELENTAGEWYLSVELAPHHLRGRYLGLFKTSMALQQAIGPLVVTAILVHWGRMGWIALGLALASAVLASRRLAAHAMS